MWKLNFLKGLWQLNESVMIKYLKNIYASVCSSSRPNVLWRYEELEFLDPFHKWRRCFDKSLEVADQALRFSFQHYNSTQFPSPFDKLIWRSISRMFKVFGPIDYMKMLDHNRSFIEAMPDKFNSKSLLMKFESLGSLTVTKQGSSNRDVFKT